MNGVFRKVSTLWQDYRGVLSDDRGGGVSDSRPDIASSPLPTRLQNPWDLPVIDVTWGERHQLLCDPYLVTWTHYPPPRTEKDKFVKGEFGFKGYQWYACTTKTKNPQETL